MKVNRFIFLLFSILLSLGACYTFLASYSQLFSDPDYIESLKIPSNYDIPMFMLFGVSFVVAVIHLIFHLFLLWFCLFKLKDKGININDFVLKNDGVIVNIIRCVGYLAIGFFVYQYFTYYFKLYIFDVMFHSSVILTISFYVVWLVTIVKYKKEITIKIG